MLQILLFLIDFFLKLVIYYVYESFFSLLKVESNKIKFINQLNRLTNYSKTTKTMPELVRFGVVTDVQYADNEDRPAWYDPSKTRYYRNALHQVHKAFQHWNREELKNKTIGFVLQLGDIIDGINAHSKHDTSLDAIKRTLNQFECNPHIPTFHAVGMFIEFIFY